MQILCFKDDQELGPFTPAEVHAALRDGTLSPSDLAWHEGLENWIPLEQVNFDSSTPPPPLPEPVVVPRSEEKPKAAPESSKAPGAPFCWWPITRAGSTIMVVCLLLGFFASVAGGLPAVILFTAFVYLSLTGVRFGLYKLFGTKRTTKALEKKPVPLWRHPVAIGAAVTMGLVLCLAAILSQQSANDSRIYEAAWQENQQQYADHNSTGKTVERYIDAFARGMSGEFDAGGKINREVEAQNNDFAQKDANYRLGYASSSQSKSDADAIAAFAFLGLIILASVIAFKVWKSRKLAKSKAASS